MSEKYFYFLNDIIPRHLTAVVDLLQLSAEERLYLHAARMGDMILLNEITESIESSKLNWNSVDYMGRNALHLAVDSENVDMIETLIEKLSFECLEEGMLHAISKGKVLSVSVICTH